MSPMHISGTLRAAAAAAAGIALLAGCGAVNHTAGGDGARHDDAAGRQQRPSATPVPNLQRIQDISGQFRSRVPAETRQIVTVLGSGPDAADSTVALWKRHGATWDRVRSWRGHNGKRGWTTHHHEGDNRSPVGVFTLSDAGGVLPDPVPGWGLPYHRSAGFAAPHSWARSHWHDFDYVIAIDYNRVKGTSPADPTRPQGSSKGGSIWLHLDHGSGTSGCVSISQSGMTYLLKALDPAQHPVVVMGDGAHLRA